MASVVTPYRPAQFGGSVLSTLPFAIYETVASLQVDADAVARAAGIDVDALQRPGARVPEEAVLRFWERAVEATSDPCLALLAARHVRPTQMHALGFAWLASPTLGDVLARIVRYQRLWLTGDLISTRKMDDGMEGMLRPTLDYPVGGGCRADAFFATLMRYMRYLADDTLNPRSVHFRHGDHGQASRYENEFCAPVTFNADVDRLVFGQDAIDRPLPGANEALAAESDRIIEAYLQQQEADRLSGRVRGLLVDLLPQGEAQQDAVAGRGANMRGPVERARGGGGGNLVWLVGL